MYDKFLTYRDIELDYRIQDAKKYVSRIGIF